MPFTKSGSKVMASMKGQYGVKGKNIFYATMNKLHMKGKWEGPKPKGHSPLHTNPMDKCGEPDNSKFSR